MNRISGFPPAIRPDSRVLILGSMPSVTSLERQQYYARKQNAFWRIMGELFSAGPDLAYAQRLKILNRAGVGLWDVVARCVRPGSLDSAIKMNDLEVNDFVSLLDRHRSVRSVFFNGRKAEEIFLRHVVPELGAKHEQLVYHSLPSTSPAMAALRFEDKLARWSLVKQACAINQGKST